MSPVPSMRASRISNYDEEDAPTPTKVPVVAHYCVQREVIGELKEIVVELRGAVNDWQKSISEIKKVVGEAPDLNGPGTGILKAVYDMQDRARIFEVNTQKLMSVTSSNPPPPALEKRAGVMAKVQMTLSVLGLMSILTAATKGGFDLLVWLLKAKGL